MNINEIATACVDRLEPTLQKIIDSHSSATHPEIVNGRQVHIDRRNRMIELVSLAIHDAVVADRMTRPCQFQKVVEAIADAESNPLYDDSRDDLLKELMDMAQETLEP
jgi:hypothetical protein